MLNFRDNFFFAKFTVLFFILTIFGYWGIDLNSEELYIGFSFFLLVIVGVLLSRRAILLIFVKSVNAKYFRILSDLLLVVNALNTRINLLVEVLNSSKALHVLFHKYVEFFVVFLSEESATVSTLLGIQASSLSAILPVSFVVFKSKIIRLKKFHSFSEVGPKFFSIKI